MGKQLKRQITQGRLIKVEQIKYFHEMENILSTMSHSDPQILKFAKDFLNALNLSDAEDGDTVQLGPMDIRMLEYLIISIVVAYHEPMWSS